MTTSGEIAEPTLPRPVLLYPIADATIDCDPSGTVLKMNEGARRLLGITMKHVTGAKIADIVPWGLAEQIPAILSEITEGIAVVATALEIVRDDNSMVDVRAKATPAFDRGSVAGFTLHLEPIGYVGVIEALPAPSEALVDRPKTSFGPGYWYCDFTDIPTFFVDARAQRILGLEQPGRVIVEEMNRRLSPVEQHRLFDALRKAVTSETSFSLDGSISLPSGETRWVHYAGVLARSALTRAIRIEGVVEDITEEQLAQDGVRRSAQLAIEIFENSPVPAQTADPSGRITLANDAFLDLLGYSRSEQVGKTFQEITHPADRDLDLMLFREVLAGSREQYEIAKRFRRADGTYVAGRLWVAPIRDESGNIVATLGQFFDQTALHTAQQEIEYLALYDPMTALAKWPLVADRVEHELQWARVGGYRLAAVMFDLDRFVAINTTYGGRNCDLMLAEVGRRLVAQLAITDVIGRMDGDTFIVVRSRVADPSQLADLAEEIEALFKEPFAAGDERVPLSASIGVALSTDASTADNLAGDARLALERAKVSGGGRWEAFDDSLRVNAQLRASANQKIQKALENDELSVHYQPVADLDSGTFVGVEALLRWMDPEVGLHLPEDFIAAAEDSGLIVAIGEYVLTQSCRDIVAWSAALGMPNLRCAVNVSPVQLQNKNFVGLVERILRETGCDPRQITVEITESTVMDRMGRNRVDELHDLGLRVSIDDFGTGYSSLGRIRHLAFDELKIDRGFTAALETSDDDRNLVSAVIEMGRALHVDVVAEGVETTEQLHWLRRHRCHLAQGFLFARPLPEDECRARLHAGWWPLNDEGRDTPPS